MSRNVPQASMVSFTLAQMRLSLPRLVAGGLAIAIGSAFVAATLLAGDVMTTTARNSVSAGYADADLVVVQALSSRQVAALRAVDGVAAVSAQQSVGAQLSGPRSSSYSSIGSLAPDPELEPQKLASGRWPAGTAEIALPVKEAERLGVRDGGSVVLTLTRTDDSSKETSTRITLAVSGLLSDPAGAFSQTGGAALATPASVGRWNRAQSQAADPVDYQPTLVLARPGTDVTELQAAAGSALATLGAAAGPYGGNSERPQVLTRDEQSDAAVAEFTGSNRMMFAFVLAFAAIALVVAALVIANTFQVLVAQRTQTLALLRCVGAVKQQLRRSVLIEALLVGLAASAAGMLGGCLLAQTTLLVLRRLEVAAQLPATVHIEVWVIVVPIVVGTVVTLLASLSPARAATRVAPLAALRPDAGPRLRERAGRARVASSVATVGLGVVLLALGLVAGAHNAVAGLGLGVLGGALSFLGIILGTVFWVPVVAGSVGRLVALASGGSAPARLAAVNSVRNPRRTAATSGALLIGVTLVALMTTGAATARTSLAEDLDATYPVDFSVGFDPSFEKTEPVSAAQLAAVRKTPGVAAATLVPGTPVEYRAGAGQDAGRMFLQGVSSDDAGRLLRSKDARAAIAAGSVVLEDDQLDGDHPDTVQLRTLGGTWRTVRASWALRGHQSLAIAPLDVMRQVAPEAVAGQAWAALAPDADAAQVLEDVQSSLAALTSGSDSSSGSAGSSSVVGLPINGNVVERNSYDKAINGILAVVVGLLAVSVVIAVVGVANTLSLSVLERRRESATLRTIGLTRRQLRWMLAVEGMVIAAVGAVAGVVLGVAYGWVGTRTVLGGLAEVSLDVPWVQLGLTVAVAVLAGLLASVIPARGAARTSPVEALTTT